MSPEARCRETRDLIAELAVGVATGDERARALAHAGRCPACRAQLAEMSALADELLLLVPAREPPVGFESRVSERLAPRRSPRRRWSAAAAAGVAAAVGAVVALAVTADERRLGASYRETLAVANGRYFSAAALETEGGARVGHVFGYQGRPSWTLVVVRSAAPAGRYAVTARTAGGRALPLGSMTVRSSGGSWSATLPVDFHDISQIDLESDGQDLEADF